MTRPIPLTAALSVILWWSSAAWGGYRDLVRDIEGYTPPPLLPAPSLNAAAGARPAGVSPAAAEAIAAARDRWAALAVDRVPRLGAPVITPELAAAAGDDALALERLRPAFRLDTLQVLITLRNPAVEAARERFRAALEGFDQVSELEAILSRYSAFTDGLMPGVGPMVGMGDDIGMRFPFPGLTALKGQVAEQNAAAARETLEMVRRDSVAQGTKAYWNLLYTHQALRVTRITLERWNQLESVATTRYGAGKTSYQDVVKIRIGREKLQVQLRTLANQRINLETELLALLDLPPSHRLGRPEDDVPDPPLPDPEELYPLALANRQELRRLRAMLGKMERMVEMAELMTQPSFSQNHSLYADQSVMQVGGAAMKPTFSTEVSPTRGAGLPKNALSGTRDAYLRETRRRLGALRADLADGEAQTRLMVRQGWFELDRARRERALFRDRLSALAQTSLDVSTRGYESGGVSFADVIAAYTDWLDIHLASQRRNSDVGIAGVELARRVGTALSATPERTSDHVR